MRLVLLLNVCCLFGCVPDIYLIDRQTVLELEASGAWPELDQKYRAQVLQSGPIPLEQAGPRIEQTKLFQMTQSDQDTPGPKKP